MFLVFGSNFAVLETLFSGGLWGVFCALVLLVCVCVCSSADRGESPWCVFVCVLVARGAHGFVNLRAGSIVVSTRARSRLL